MSGVFTHNHAASGLQAPQRVFSVDLVSEFSLHQCFLLGSVPHTHSYTASLQTDTDLRTAATQQQKRLMTELRAVVLKCQVV